MTELNLFKTRRLPWAGQMTASVLLIFFLIAFEMFGKPEYLVFSGIPFFLLLLIPVVWLLYSTYLATLMYIVSPTGLTVAHCFGNSQSSWEAVLELDLTGGSQARLLLDSGEKVRLRLGALREPDDFLNALKSYIPQEKVRDSTPPG